MLIKSTTFKTNPDGLQRDVLITPLFFQNHKDSWQPNEIFELLETRRFEDGVWIDHKDPVELGKIIVDDQKEWRYTGESDLSWEDIRDIVEFVLT